MPLRFLGTGGATKVSLGTLDVPASTSALTICAWIKPENFDVNGATVISKRNSSAESGVWWSIDILLSTYQKIRVRLKTGTTTTTLLATDPLSFLTANVERFVVLWYGMIGMTSTLKIYVDNIEAATVAKSGNVAIDASVSTYIGEAPVVNQNFTGPIDDVRIYTRALSLSEMTTIFYSEGEDSIVSNLYARWKMDEKHVGATATVASSIIDCGGNNFHGTPSGSPTYIEPLTPYWKLLAELSPDVRGWLDYHNFSAVSHANNTGQIGEYSRTAGVGYNYETLLKWNTWSEYANKTIYEASLKFVSSSKGTNTLAGTGYLYTQDKTNPASWSSPPIFTDFAVTAWATQLASLSVQLTGTYEFINVSDLIKNLVQGWINGTNNNWGMVMGANFNALDWYLSVDSVVLRLLYR